MLLEEKTGPLLCRTHLSSPPAGVECCMTYLGTRCPNTEGKRLQLKGTVWSSQNAPVGDGCVLVGWDSAAAWIAGRWLTWDHAPRTRDLIPWTAAHSASRNGTLNCGGGIEEQAQGVVRARWTPSVARSSMGSRWHVLLKCIKIFMSVFINKHISIFEMSTWIILS